MRQLWHPHWLCFGAYWQSRSHYEIGIGGIFFQRVASDGPAPEVDWVESGLPGQGTAQSEKFEQLFDV